MNALVNLVKLFKFNGGVHPPQHKQASTTQPIRVLQATLPLVLPLRQHVGNIPHLRVQVGERVLKGQLLAEAEGGISAAIHAPTSGIITAIQDALIPHPSGLPDRCLTLQPDGLDEWTVLTPIDWQHMEARAVVASLRQSGIVGLGGAAFPTHIKLRSDGRSGIHTLVINAAECEPYITCDDMVMRERAADLLRGIAITQHLLGAERCLIGIEDNKPEAAAALRAACDAADSSAQVIVVPTIYPSGDARRLIHVLTGLEIPSHQRSVDVGVQCFNVATVLAIYRYMRFGEPALSRIVTVTGNVARPGNFEVPLGMPVSALLEAAGGVLEDTSEFIMGGPMMGFSLPSPEVPVTKATNCIIASTPRLFPPAAPAMPCIRCARCAEACPVSLQPQELYWFAKSDNFDKARDYKLFDCIECGCCSYVCPSNIPLVQYYRYAKSEIIAQDRAKEAANLARERNDFRLMRIEREKQERALKHAQKAAGAKAEAGKTEPSKAESGVQYAGDAAVNVAASPASAQAEAVKKAAIAAAIERAKAQKAAQAAQNTAAVNPAVAAEMAAIDARRAEAAALAAKINKDDVAEAAAATHAADQHSTINGVSAQVASSVTSNSKEPS
ncbi:electron transport complex subunit RsxC [Pseudomethylobacillus aquaticus]|uniref:Ion-translocating oxidoreductase complex subunit C n=1 Tax=Pseudomethylobacillus aquaticus TaxID=2676064 RepID=A0A3N0V754_9PROT|nr:electron transport complex subunit RsxC [Pseudomethylobacillus aquaticus]ROH88525.1 electron transport complex subunit RsxC [Pseudomethylobacillus aquaticus]